MKNKIIFGGMAALALLVFVFWLAGRDKITLNISTPVAKNLRYASQASAGKADYFNGSAFMEMDLLSQATKALTPSFFLPNVVDVRWSKV